VNPCDILTRGVLQTGGAIYYVFEFDCDWYVSP
jgi:hypothetical protein